MGRIQLRFDHLESREVPAKLFATGADAGGGPHVKVFNAATNQVVFSFMAYDPGFTGGVRVAVGDVTGDGQDDIVTAAGAGGGPHVKVFDGATGSLVREFMAYDPLFRGGVYVAVADVDGDHKGDIITGPGFGGGPHVKVFSGADNSVLKSFLAFPVQTITPNEIYFSGCTVAGGDLNGDGFADVVAGSGPGRYSQALAYDGKTGVLLMDLQPIFAGFFGGVFISCGDVNGDHHDDLAISLGAGLRSTPQFPSTVFVTVYDSGPLNTVGGVQFAYDVAFHGGVRIAMVDVNGDGVAEIITSPGPGGGPHVKVFNATNGQTLSEFMAYDPAFAAGVFVG